MTTEEIRVIRGLLELGDLREQRQWQVARHLPNIRDDKEDLQSRRKQTIICKFPTEGEEHNVQICRTMFFNTKGIAERQVRIVLGKTDVDGTRESCEEAGLLLAANLMQTS